MAETGSGNGGDLARREGSRTAARKSGTEKSVLGRRTSESGRAKNNSGTETVHNRIAVLRAERAISRRQLADALGAHYQTVGYLERGEYSPSLYLALRIAEYFEVPVEVIFSTSPFPRIGSTTESESTA